MVEPSRRAASGRLASRFLRYVMIKTMVETVKKIHKEDLVLIKIGNFYHAYGKDAYIICYLFDYKIRNDFSVTCGFPVNSLNKILSKLEDEKINYLVLDRHDNYNVDEVYDNKNLNNYQKVYEKAKKDISYMMKVDNII